MANTKSARKATRKIARRTEVNKARRSLLRNSVRKVEEAIASGDRNAASAAFKEAEPVIMRAAQRGVVHKNNASRKVSRLTHRIAKLAQVSRQYASFASIALGHFRVKFVPIAANSECLRAAGACCCQTVIATSKNFASRDFAGQDLRRCACRMPVHR